ncbi:MAG: outer membrane protein OmpA-like peptidoglycan-associated protein [Flavobacteriales bacterium]|jgi:outer membrane protein OmpA-like peptidoglycan-associated protein
MNSPNLYPNIGYFSCGTKCGEIKWWKRVKVIKFNRPGFRLFTATHPTRCEMKKVLIVTFLVLLTAVSFASIKVRRAIEFPENSSVLARNAAEVLDDFDAYTEGFIVEKINIVSISTSGEQSFHEIKLSKQRSEAVFQFLTSNFPDESVYELTYRDGGNRLHNAAYGTDFVIITAYFIEMEAPSLAQPERVLFPEEFGGIERLNFPVALSMNVTGAKESYSMSSVYFEGNSSVYKNKSEPSLNALMNFMENHPSIHIRLEGHVNGKMGGAYLKRAAKTNPERVEYKNAEDLSLARAETVKSFLTNGGIDPSRIECFGKGGKEMVFKRPKNERENAANRRIEVTVIQ